jgi:hypothetical protein
MLVPLIEASLRSLIFGAVVWAGLRIFRVHNVVTQRCAWIAVLAGSLLMPLALTFTSHWHLPAFATIPAPISLQHLQPALLSKTPAAPQAIVTLRETWTAPAHKQSSARGIAIKHPGRSAAAADSLPADRVLELDSPPVASPDPLLPTRLSQISLVSIAMRIYFLIAAALVLRLLFGLLSAMVLWHTATPIPPVTDVPFGADLYLRWSRKISAPVTIGSGIVLPAGYKSWPQEKVRVVLAHERSHVRQRDFHLQILASLYAAVVWFSPLGWWLKHKLSDLSEAISDRSGLNAASTRSVYAQVLLEFAAAPRPTLIGVAMARPSNISRRIERLLNDSDLHRAFSGNARARIAVLVAPAILFAAAAVVRVQASQANRLAGAPIKVAANLLAPPAPLSSQAKLVLDSPSAHAELALAAPPLAAEPDPAMQNGAAPTENAFDRNLTVNGKLELSVATGSGNITLTRGSANRIHIHGVVKAGNDADPAQVQQIVANPPIEQEGNSIRIGGHQQNLHNISISYEIEAPADTDLSASTGSGSINDTGVGHDATLNTGSGNITATGLEGDFKSQTGSGNIAIDTTDGGNARAQTGSGTIDLKGVHGSLDAQTGSGTIKASGTPSSPWKVQSGSGSIELSTGNAPMNLDASVGSGTMAIHFANVTQTAGAPTERDRHHLHTQLNGGGPEVHVQTGSGNIHIE